MLKKKVIASLSAVALLGGSFAGNFVEAAAKPKYDANVLVKEASVKENMSFKDVTKQSYAYEAIMYLSKEGIVQGYGNGY